jgi:hypothetical protein
LMARTMLISEMSVSCVAQMRRVCKPSVRLWDEQFQRLCSATSHHRQLSCSIPPCRHLSTAGTFCTPASYRFHVVFTRLPSSHTSTSTDLTNCSFSWRPTTFSCVQQYSFDEALHSLPLSSFGTVIHSHLFVSSKDLALLSSLFSLGGLHPLL